MSVTEIFHEGGFIMYPLLVFSVLVWAVASQKFFYLKSFHRDAKKLDQELSRAVASKDFAGMNEVLKKFPAPISRPHEILLEETFVTKDDLKDKLYRRLSETNSALKDHLWILGTISSSAPFIGLFGTVLGIMESFKAIGDTGKSGFSVVAGGISESLIATAAGIIVAVIAVLFYNYFQTRVNKEAQEFKHRVEDLADLIFSAKRGK